MLLIRNPVIFSYEVLNDQICFIKEPLRYMYVRFGGGGGGDVPPHAPPRSCGLLN